MNNESNGPFQYSGCPGAATDDPVNSSPTSKRVSVLHTPRSRCNTDSAQIAPGPPAYILAAAAQLRRRLATIKTE